MGLVRGQPWFMAFCLVDLGGHSPSLVPPYRHQGGQLPFLQLALDGVAGACRWQEDGLINFSKSYLKIGKASTGFLLFPAIPRGTPKCSREGGDYWSFIILILGKLFLLSHTCV